MKASHGILGTLHVKYLLLNQLVWLLGNQKCIWITDAVALMKIKTLQIVRTWTRLSEALWCS